MFREQSGGQCGYSGESKDMISVGGCGIIGVVLDVF